MALQLDLDRERYVSLLEKLIGEVEFLQDNPPNLYHKRIGMRDRVLLICIRTRLHALLKIVVAVTSSHAEYQYSVSRCHLPRLHGCICCTGYIFP